MFNSTSTPLILLGVLGVIVGIIAIAWPGATVLALVILFAIYAFIGAGLQAARALSRATAGATCCALIDLAAGWLPWSGHGPPHCSREPEPAVAAPRTKGTPMVVKPDLSAQLIRPRGVQRSIGVLHSVGANATGTTMPVCAAGGQTALVNEAVDRLRRKDGSSIPLPCGHVEASGNRRHPQCASRTFPDQTPRTARPSVVNGILRLIEQQITGLDQGLQGRFRLPRRRRSYA